jgi:hypothetical protein
VEVCAQPKLVKAQFLRSRRTTDLRWTRVKLEHASQGPLSYDEISRAVDSKNSRPRERSSEAWLGPHRRLFSREIR